jgi:glycine betaine/proline transport system substrate-binding protein
MIAGLGLSGCASAESDSSKGEITIGVFSGWGESIVTSELWKIALEKEGYDVELDAVDPNPVFIGLTEGTYDFATQVTLPESHADYKKQYADDLEDLGAWYDEVNITVAVNEDAPIDSLDELADHADDFGNEIIGIEPGAGQTALMEDTVIPGYGLDDMEFVTSSTGGMLTSLAGGIKSGENVVVSLWEPHWAYVEYPIKSLKDPKGLLGDTESHHIYSSTELVEEHPEVSEWLKDFSMTPDQLLELEHTVFVDHKDDDEADGVKAWADENTDFVDSMTK